MLRAGRGMRVCLIWALMLQLLCPLQIWAGDSIFGGFGKSRSRPKTQLEELAEAVDKLEREIDCYGSVVIKQPDIWGEARWTSHRQEFEKTMEKELEEFQFTINAQITEADTSFGMMAASLSAAAGGSTTTSIEAEQIESISVNSLDPHRPAIINRGEEIKGITVEPTVYLDQMARYIKHLHQLRRINEGDDTADASGYALNLMRIPASILPGSKTRTGYGAEVTLTLTPELSEDLLPETFKDLVFNDLVDQLSLPLLRVAENEPWAKTEKTKREIEEELYNIQALMNEVESIGAIADYLSFRLGKKFEDFPDRGKQNVSSVSQNPSIACLSPSDIARLINKLARSFAYKADEIIGVKYTDVNHNYTEDSKEKIKLIRGKIRNNLYVILINSDFGHIDSLIARAKNQLISEDLISVYNTVDKSTAEKISKITNERGIKETLINVDLDNVAKEAIDNWSASQRAAAAAAAAAAADGNKVAAEKEVESAIEKIATTIQASKDKLNATANALQESSINISDIIQNSSESIDDVLSVSLLPLVELSNNPIVSSSRQSAARYSIPPTQLACAFGKNHLLCLAKAISDFHRASQHKHIHVFDVQGFLGEELEAAYQYLRALEERGSYNAWYSLCPQISQAIRLLKFDANAGEESLCKLREQFERCSSTLQIQASENCPTPGLMLPCPSCNNCQSATTTASCKTCDVSTTKALAWAILVDSALLNDQLFDDMQRIQKAKHLCFVPEYNPNFYGPNPSCEAREIFNQYVQARWPIHVFALDPEVQEQNVTDAYARRRETQLALAMAFANGEIGANTFSRYARQNDFQLETISLNRTVIGFSHGSNTFGWRFYPRVQVPPTPGHFKAGWQTWVAGAPSRDDDLKCRQLEPGPRELLAIVVMPSFVPYLRVDSRSNWFKLTDPKRKEFTTEDSVRMGHMIQYIHNCKEACLHENEIYRPGDVMRVMEAVNQLERRLPLQDTLAQIPYENDLGGYRLFALGKRNLGPELIGYYGEPGINLEGTTKLFLVGRGFNVISTKVIVGGQSYVPELLSRDVMQVEIVKGAYTTTVNVNGKEEEQVDIHVATPYGVSGHLLVPTVKKPVTPPGFSFSFGEVFGCLNYDGCLAKSLSLVQNDLVVKGPVPDNTAAELTLKMVAVFADGTERGLKSLLKTADTYVLPPKVFNKGAISLTASDLSNFMLGEPRLIAQQPPIALKVTGTVKIGNKTSNLSNQLLIKLAVQQPRPCCPTPQEMMWTSPQAAIFNQCPPPEKEPTPHEGLSAPAATAPAEAAGRPTIPENETKSSRRYSPLIIVPSIVSPAPSSNNDFEVTPPPHSLTPGNYPPGQLPAPPPAPVSLGK